MKETEISSLKDDAEHIFQEYELRFAGKPRPTRSLETLERLIDELEEVDRRLEQIGGSDSAGKSALEERITENLERYRSEYDAIRQLKMAQSPNVKAGRLANWANLHFGRYFRHFAGQNRATRNPVLLTRIIEGLEEIDSELEDIESEMDDDGVEQDREAIAENLELYRSEYDKILDIQNDGDKQEQISLLAHLANRQFERYQTHYAGQPRPSRSLKLLDEIIESLEEIEKRMQSLRKQGVTSVQNRRNLDIVQEQLETYREERKQIKAMKSDLVSDERLSYLGQAANAMFETYREEFAGKSRSDRDLEQLSTLCEELFEIGLELESVLEEDPTENQIYGVVMDHLAMFQDEYEKIWQAQTEEGE